MRFMAMLSVPWASGDRAPSDIAGVTKRRRMTLVFSTSSTLTGSATCLKSSRSRMLIGGRARKPLV
jgi:hypothetical protein